MGDQSTQPTVFTATPNLDGTVTTTTDPVQQDTPSLPAVSDLTNELVGEGKKYASVEDALAALPHAQSHISTIESENATLRQEIAKSATIQDVLSQIKANQQSVPDPEVVTVDNKAIADQVLQQIKAQERAQTTANNILTADAAVRELYGEQAAAVTEGVAKELGISLAMMQDLAGKSPNALLKLLADKTTNVSTVPLHVKSGVNTEVITANTPVDNLKKPAKSVLAMASQGELLTEWRRCKQLAENDTKS